METVFEVTTGIRKAFVTAFFQRYLRYRLWILAVYAVILAGLIAETLFGNLLLIEILLACGIWVYCLPWFYANRLMKQEHRFRDGEEPIFTVTFAEKIQSTTTEGSYAIPYDKITRIYNIPCGIVLLDARKKFVLLDKTGFTKGNFEEFVRFIQEKCPQAKVYR